jgi:hypothetical protein
MLKEMQTTLNNALNQFNADGILSWESYDEIEMWFPVQEFEDTMVFTDREVKSLTSAILTDMVTALNELENGSLAGLSDDEIMEGNGFYDISEAIAPLWTELCGVQVEYTQRATARTRRTKELVAEATADLDIDFSDPESMAKVAEALTNVVNEQIIEEAVNSLDDDIDAFFGNNDK